MVAGVGGLTARTARRVQNRRRRASTREHAHTLATHPADTFRARVALGQRPGAGAVRTVDLDLSTPERRRRRIGESMLRTGVVLRRVRRRRQVQWARIRLDGWRQAGRRHGVIPPGRGRGRIEGRLNGWERLEIAVATPLRLVRRRGERLLQRGRGVGQRPQGTMRWRETRRRLKRRRQRGAILRSRRGAVEQSRHGRRGGRLRDRSGSNTKFSNQSIQGTHRRQITVIVGFGGRRGGFDQVFPSLALGPCCGLRFRGERLPIAEAGPSPVFFRSRALVLGSARILRDGGLARPLNPVSALDGRQGRRPAGGRMR